MLIIVLWVKYNLLPLPPVANWRERGEIVTPFGNNTQYRIEVKNCVDCVNSSVIKKQFIERDLYNATSIDEIKWKIYGQNFTKNDLTSLLNGNLESIEALGKDKISMLTGDPNILNMNINQASQKLIDYLINDVDFSKIFLE